MTIQNSVQLYTRSHCLSPQRPSPDRAHSRSRFLGWVAGAAGALLLPLAVRADSIPFDFSTGSPDGRMATASRPDSPGAIEIESADDFVVSETTAINQATFTGLIPLGATLADVQQVVVEIYRVFPKDSVNPPNGQVPTRVNSPSDVAFATRDSASSELTYSPAVVSANFTTLNSVLNGIHPSPNQKTGGEGPVTGQEVKFTVSFATPFNLPADHYFFIPQVKMSTGSGNFYWLSAPKPIVADGTPFLPDLQSWIRNADLDPNWLRIGTDIVGGSPAPTFNAAFTLSGTATDSTSSVPDAAPTAVLLGLACFALVGSSRVKALQRI